MTEPSSREAIHDAVQELRRRVEAVNQQAGVLVWMGLDVSYDTFADETITNQPGRSSILTVHVKRVKTY